MPNHKGCRFPVPSSFNLACFRSLLADYSDADLCDHLEFGFPLGFCGDPIPPRTVRNHQGAIEFASHVDKYVTAELEARHIAGPFPFPILPDTTISPLNTVPKSNSLERRVILDLSFPKEGPSVNLGIDILRFFGSEFVLTYPKVDDLIRLVHEKGQGCALFKVDLHWAYRHLPVDPGDVNLLAFLWWCCVFYELVMSMGGRSSALACQRTSNAVTYICHHWLQISLVAYLDDFGGAESWDRAWQSFYALRIILALLGFKESEHKASPPSTTMEFLGLLIDTLAMTLEGSPEKLKKLFDILASWAEKTQASKQEMQSLAGLLNFVATCVPAGRVFMFRLFNFIRSAPDEGVHPVSAETLKDIFWWQCFLPVFNGVSLIPPPEWEEPDFTVASDACLTGCGALIDGEFFHCIFPEEFLSPEFTINDLELLTVIVALKVWGRRFKGKRVHMWCDNLSTVCTLQSGRSRSKFFQSCHRELAFLQGLYDFSLKFSHIPGKDNRDADLLSRFHLSPAFPQEFYERFAGKEMKEIYVWPGLFSFSHTW